MKNFEMIVFDIDGTLALSKQSIDLEMAKLLSNLVERKQVAIISGASFKQFEWQILSKLDCAESSLTNLWLLPVDGTSMCRYSASDKSWQCKTDKELTIEEKTKIRNAFENIFEKAALEKPQEIYGELVEDRGAQMNFSALGQEAPPEPKAKWDPDNKKRQAIVEILKKDLPEYSLRIGGTTSIEVTKEGVDKGYGLRKLVKESGVSVEQTAYIGDKLFEGGNDEPAIFAGLHCIPVSNVEDTKIVIKQLLEA